MRLIKTIRNVGLTIFGDIKVFPYPMFLLYDPGSYLIKGDEMREVIKIIKEGDILIRGYKNYLDGYFIPGFFSHAGLYLGEVTKEKVLHINPQARPDAIKEGEQLVIHAMAQGVFMEDLLNFCRCDYMVILRRNTQKESPKSQAFSHTQLFENAVTHLDKPYDFGFNFSDIEALSCTEFVYLCYRDIMEDYHVSIKKRQVLLLRKNMIIPDDFLTDKFELVWKSKRTKESRIARIISNNTKTINM